MATNNTTQVKFVKVNEFADFKDITTADGTIYFIEDIKKIHLDGKMYGFNDSDIDLTPFLRRDGDTHMTGYLDMSGNPIIDVTSITAQNGFSIDTGLIIEGGIDHGTVMIKTVDEDHQDEGEWGEAIFSPDGLSFSSGLGQRVNISGLQEFHPDYLTFEQLSKDNALSVGTLLNYKGAAGGFAELDSTGVVPTHQLPSYVDDIMEFTNQESFPVPGEAAKLYVDLSNSFMYRWGGTAYYNVSDGNTPLKLGTTSSTAYRGDRGLAAYNHSKATGNPHGVTKSHVSLGKVENYGIASVIEAKQGSAKDKYMTPQTTKEAIVTLAPKLTWTVVS